VNAVDALKLKCVDMFIKNIVRYVIRLPLKSVSEAREIRINIITALLCSTRFLFYIDARNKDGDVFETVIQLWKLIITSSVQ